MTEQIKAWALVNKNNVINSVFREKYKAENDLIKRETLGFMCPYKVIELISAPEKIKMTQAEFDEFKRLREMVFVSSLRAVLEKIESSSKSQPLRNYLFSNDTWRLDQKAQADFACLWASENPEELVEIENEQEFYLVSKLDEELAVVRERGGGLSFGQARKTFTDAEIEELGGDDWLAEMGLKKLEVEDD